MNHFRGETCKKGTETGEEGACVPRFWQFGEQEFVFRVVFIGPQVFKTKDANDSEGLGHGLLVPAGQWSMCWRLGVSVLTNRLRQTHARGGHCPGL